jgi:protein SERAC1
MLDALAPSKIFDSEGPLVDALKEGSETLQNITDMFTPLMKNFHIMFFWEQYKTDLAATFDYIVEESSAAPILADTERAGLPADHRNMAKFESPKAGGYRLVCSVLLRYSRDAPEVIERRWRQAVKMMETARQNEAAELLY